VEDRHEVAQAGIDGLTAGKAVVVPGRVNRVAAAFFRVAREAPHAPLLPLLVRKHPGMKRH
jgi:hypothetical protein